MLYSALSVSEQNLIPYTSTSLVGRGPVLVFAPHPDDEVLGCGGAVALHCAAGDSVQVVIITDGAQQVNSSVLNSQIGASIRMNESLQAAVILGYENIECWHIPDRALAQNLLLVERIFNLLVTSKARVVYGPSPYEIHPDHRALALFLAQAAYAVGGEARLVGYEISGTLHPNLLIDISTVMAQKLRAIKCFHSQLAVRPYDRYIEGLNSYRAYTLAPETQYVEAYFSCKFNEVMKVWLGNVNSDIRQDVSLSVLKRVSRFLQSRFIRW